MLTWCRPALWTAKAQLQSPCRPWERVRSWERNRQRPRGKPGGSRPAAAASRAAAAAAATRRGTDAAAACRGPQLGGTRGCRKGRGGASGGTSRAPQRRHYRPGKGRRGRLMPSRRREWLIQMRPRGSECVYKPSNVPPRERDRIWWLCLERRAS